MKIFLEKGAPFPELDEKLRGGVSLDIVFHRDGIELKIYDGYEGRQEYKVPDDHVADVHRLLTELGRSLIVPHQVLRVRVAVSGWYWDHDKTTIHVKDERSPKLLGRDGDEPTPTLTNLASGEAAANAADAEAAAEAEEAAAHAAAQAAAVAEEAYANPDMP